MFTNFANETTRLIFLVNLGMDHEEYMNRPTTAFTTTFEGCIGN
jgi:hypothetical protein